MYCLQTVIKNLRTKSFYLPLLGLLFLFSGCSEDEPEPEPPTPWADHVILPGNLSINSAAITMIEEISSIDYYSDGTDYYSNSIRRSGLPSTDFEFYSVFIYVPTDQDFYVTSISGAGATLYYYDGNSVRIPSDNSSSFVNSTTISGVQYSVYELVIRDTNLLANNRTFERITYAFNVAYEDGETGSQVQSSLVNVEIFADTPSEPDNGDISFWVSSDFGCGSIDVTLSGVGTDRITGFYTTNPGCGASGNANFTNLEFGSYTFNATSTQGCTWSGTVNLSSSCRTPELTL